MAYAELIAAGYLGILTACMNAHGLVNQLFVKAPAPILGAILMADALARLGFLRAS